MLPKNYRKHNTNFFPTVPLAKRRAALRLPHDQLSLGDWEVQRRGSFRKYGNYLNLIADLRDWHVQSVRMVILVGEGHLSSCTF